VSITVTASKSPPCVGAIGIVNCVELTAAGVTTWTISTWSGRGAASLAGTGPSLHALDTMAAMIATRITDPSA
jgi:hypothetical protein